ncbi:unnamed protein product [Caenorhabditis auriculariae]|uniref:Uncharacterized protein n=1 Tax=Caenorhabditis auriculariae TaxID=2777116 RepID=A0A8S1HRR7_9PELO|nr:unnamed protein product [Caenorhabditis auriculariae]
MSNQESSEEQGIIGTAIEKTLEIGKAAGENLIEADRKASEKTDLGGDKIYRKWNEIKKKSAEKYDDMMDRERATSEGMAESNPERNLAHNGDKPPKALQKNEQSVSESGRQEAFNNRRRTRRGGRKNRRVDDRRKNPSQQENPDVSEGAEEGVMILPALNNVSQPKNNNRPRSNTNRQRTCSEKTKDGSFDDVKEEERERNAQKRRNSQKKHRSSERFGNAPPQEGVPEKAARAAPTKNGRRRRNTENPRRNNGSPQTGDDRQKNNRRRRNTVNDQPASDKAEGMPRVSDGVRISPIEKTNKKKQRRRNASENQNNVKTDEKNSQRRELKKQDAEEAAQKSFVSQPNDVVSGKAARDENDESGNVVFASALLDDLNPSTHFHLDIFDSVRDATRKNGMKQKNEDGEKVDARSAKKSCRHPRGRKIDACSSQQKKHHGFNQFNQQSNFIAGH